MLNSCLKREYNLSLIELFIEEYHDCLNMSNSLCFIKLYGIVILNRWTHILLNPILSNISFI